jgi:hypothetical protein
LLSISPRQFASGFRLADTTRVSCRELVSACDFGYLLRNARSAARGDAMTENVEPAFVTRQLEMPQIEKDYKACRFAVNGRETFNQPT